MKLTITDSAALLYKEEIPLQDGDTIRLYVRVGGVGSGGFSVGIMKEDSPTDTSFTIIKQGITFFVTEDDFWYLDGMKIQYNEDTGFLDFQNPQFTQLDHPEK
ncbi:iron-sulfur cluster biosynthesis family protein [Alkalihalobacillus deserti]|uniref:iron-sulfur cluster biosynthesis family protein n=1 Tax=Alkalihalobacillus deserti TaxID=2879466 RepID=UPI001D13B274|nr:iron-sulfur cluster biosynthesis family protein [Alkalihalobacillus deserti]